MSPLYTWFWYNNENNQLCLNIYSYVIIGCRDICCLVVDDLTVLLKNVLLPSWLIFQYSYEFAWCLNKDTPHSDKVTMAILIGFSKALDMVAPTNDTVYKKWSFSQWFSVWNNNHIIGCKHKSGKTIENVILFINSPSTARVILINDIFPWNEYYTGN